MILKIDFDLVKNATIKSAITINPKKPTMNPATSHIIDISLFSNVSEISNNSDEIKINIIGNSLTNIIF